MPTTNRYYEKDFVVLTAGRTGSNFLQHLMRINGFTDPNEWFHPEFGFREAVAAGQKTENYLESLKNKHTVNGLFGVKIMVGHLELMEANMQSHNEGPPPDILLNLFPSAKFVLLERQDIVRQAVSNWLASKTGQYALWRTQRKLTWEGGVDVSAVDSFVSYIEAASNTWTTFLTENRIVAHKMFYESLTSEPEQQFRNFLHFLGVEMPHSINVSVPILKQADARSERFVNEYLASRPDKVHLTR